MKDSPKIKTVPPSEILSDFSVKNRILIIDDSVDNIKVMGSILKEHNYEVLAASDPRKGVSIAENKLPDLILLDIMMPVMDGYKVCHVLKKNKVTQDIPIIFLTALADNDSIVKGFESGAVDYVNKPFNTPELLARIKNHLSLRVNNEHTKAFFESVYHTYISIDRNLNIVNFNNIANIREELFGSAKFKTGNNIFNYISQEDHTIFKRKIECVFNGKVSVLERSYKVKDNTCWFNYIFEPIINNQGDIIGCLINGTDITEKKGFELRVQEYTRKLKELYNDTQESLVYASYIQNALFPSRKQFENNFAEHFMIFKPKDKVSGDFYWMHEVGNKVIFVLGDCTGHGVPGALLTTISVVMLDRIVKYNGVFCAKEILSEIDSSVNETLKQTDGGLENGMEIAVCLFDKKKQVVEFAGAKRSLIVIRDKKAVEIKGQRTDLGGSGDKTFHAHHVKFDENSLFYLYTDGFTDQIGGESGKRFMKKNLHNLIEANQNEPIIEQKVIFEQALSSWMGTERQTDDITLIGLKVL